MNQELKKVLYEDGDIRIEPYYSEKDRTLWFSGNDLSVLFKKSRAWITQTLKIVLQSDTLMSDEKQAFSKIGREFSKIGRQKIKEKASDGKVHYTLLYDQNLLIELDKKYGTDICGSMMSFINSLQPNHSNNRKIVIYDNGLMKINVRFRFLKTLFG